MACYVIPAYQRAQLVLLWWLVNLTFFQYYMVQFLSSGSQSTAFYWSRIWQTIIHFFYESWILTGRKCQKTIIFTDLGFQSVNSPKLPAWLFALLFDFRQLVQKVLFFAYLVIQFHFPPKLVAWLLSKCQSSAFCLWRTMPKSQFFSFSTPCYSKNAKKCW